RIEPQAIQQHSEKKSDHCRQKEGSSKLDKIGQCAMEAAPTPRKPAKTRVDRLPHDQGCGHANQWQQQQHPAADAVAAASREPSLEIATKEQAFDPRAEQ